MTLLGVNSHLANILYASSYSCGRSVAYLGVPSAPHQDVNRGLSPGLAISVSSERGAALLPPGSGTLESPPRAIAVLAPMYPRSLCCLRRVIPIIKHPTPNMNPELSVPNTCPFPSQINPWPVRIRYHQAKHHLPLGYLLGQALEKCIVELIYIMPTIKPTRLVATSSITESDHVPSSGVDLLPFGAVDVMTE